uniref:Pyrin domain-containing protein n=1 Tax=Nothobranchius korthausae TaxID=1143690 RepID=A0A1A8GJN0_9TELE
MSVQKLLLQTLENMTNDNFKTFKWYLNLGIPKGHAPIPKSQLEGATREEAVTKMTESYGQDKAVAITIEVLKEQGLNGTAEELRNAYVGEITTAPSGTSSSTNSSAVIPPAAPMVSAQGGSVIVAPTIQGGATGSWNITINKS